MFMKPTTVQYVLASDWLPYCWQWTWSLIAVGAAIWTMNPGVESLGDLSFALNFVAAVVLAFFVGGFASILPRWFVFGPILYSQGLENGGPFVPGDRVCILAGKHRGKTALVYESWQNETVRVELGGADKAQYTDIFAAYQLIRVPADEQCAAHGVTAHPVSNE